MTKIAKSLGLFALVCSACVQAQVSHVSINSRMFELGAYPKMRVNVITDNQDMTRLEFAVLQSGGEEKLMAEQLNRFLVLLTGVEDVTDPKARLLVREYRVDRWYEVKNLPLFDNTSSATSSVSQAKTAVVKSSKAAKAETSLLATSSAVTDKAAAVKSSKPVQEVNLVTAEADVAPVVVAAVTTEVAATPRASGFTFPEDKTDVKASSTSSSSVVASDEAKPKAAKSEVTNSDPSKSELSKADMSISEPSTTEVASVLAVAQAPSASADMVKIDKSTTTIDAPEVKTAEATNAEGKLVSSINANATNSGECMLDYHNETLWRIANRYAPEWKVNVYGAMLAIHDANPKAFSKNRINALKKDATLYCPSAEILSRYPDAQAARTSFEDREAGR
ncbi:FimV/HubP family polar landmark protein [Shewanella mangrovisoli]|uniref:FimV/HubP family polar landmark protein n=1 Tax=Shewanella mangrovisoli TaxID=2864211 RepID=UPI0035B73FDD